MYIYAKDGEIEKIRNSYNFLLGNHSSGIDHFVPPSWADRMRILGTSNSFIKKSIMYFPIIGQCFMFCCRFIFLDRSFVKDEKNIQIQLEEFIKLKYPGASTIFFPEGTRFTPQKHEKSTEFAKSRNLPILNHHLIPRTRGFKTCVEVMKKVKEKCIILNYQTFYKGPKPTIVNLFQGKSMEFHIYMETIEIENVEATDEWLINLYKFKDKLHESFEKFGNFYEGRNQIPVKAIEIKPRLRILINFIFWFFVSISSCIKFAIWMYQNDFTIILTVVLFTCELIGWLKNYKFIKNYFNFIYSLDLHLYDHQNEYSK